MSAAIDAPLAHTTARDEVNPSDQVTPVPNTERLEGSLWVYLQYEVSEEINLQELSRLAGVQAPAREPVFRHPAPDYVRFERPPVALPLPALPLLSGERLGGRIKYFDYGVVSMELELPFHLGWDDLVLLASRWISSPELERLAVNYLREHIEPLRPALVKPYGQWLSEDYYVLHVRSAGGPVLASDMLAQRGAAIAQIVRGEAKQLSLSEQSEALTPSMSYYPTDLIVVGWLGAFVYDSTPSAASVLQLLEYANTQLLEYRHYDEVLTRVLAEVYKTLGRERSFLSRWRKQREAYQLNTLRLDVRELTERTDNSIKFLSDMFYARAYKLASSKVGVNDYRELVDEKLRTAADLYQALIEDFRQGRAFFLELAVVVILVIELVMVFRGK